MVLQTTVAKDFFLKARGRCNERSRIFGGYIHDFCDQNGSTKPLFGTRENKRTGKADFQILLTCL